MYVAANKPQRPAARSAAKPQKPTLGADVIQSAMDRRPRLNANMRRAPAKPAGGMVETPGINPAAGMPNGVPPRLQAMAAKDPAAAQARYAQFRAGGLPGQAPRPATDILTAPPPPGASGPTSAELPPPKGPFAGGPPPMAAGFSELPMDAGGGIDPNGGIGSAVQATRDFWTPERMAQARPVEDVVGAPSGSQNPQFSANLPPDIMQRLQALQAGRGGAGVMGGQGAPGTQPPGAPGSGPMLPDFYQNPVLPRGQRPVSTFDRRMTA